MESVPSFVSVTFAAVVITTFGFLFYAVKQASKGKKDFSPTVVLTFLAVWIFIVSIATFYGFFRDYDSRPPRFIYLILPPMIAIVGLFAVRTTRDYMMRLPLSTLTYIHIIRVPVEMVLWWLASFGLVSSILTFEGVNFDILTGISAPFAGVFLVGMRSQSRMGAILWNIAGLILLLNVVIRAVWSTPFFFNPDVFDVPNTGVFYFPFILLPAFVVPSVLFCHIVSLVRLFGQSEEEY